MDRGVVANLNSYKDYYVAIIDGKGLGQARKITGHTLGDITKITVSPAWDVIPDKTSKISYVRVPVVLTALVICVVLSDIVSPFLFYVNQ